MTDGREVRIGGEITEVDLQPITTDNCRQSEPDRPDPER